MIATSVKLKIAPEKREAALEILYSLLEPTRVIPGCMSCRLYQDLENQNVILYVETWHDQAALERHIRSELYRNILFVMEMGIEPPEINFKTVTHLSGMEVIEALRSFPNRKSFSWNRLTNDS